MTISPMRIWRQPPPSGRKEEWMKSKIFIIVAIMLASIAQAKEPKPHQTGTLLQMDRRSAV